MRQPGECVQRLELQRNWRLCSVRGPKKSRNACLMEASKSDHEASGNGEDKAAAVTDEEPCIGTHTERQVGTAGTQPEQTDQNGASSGGSPDTGTPLSAYGLHVPDIAERLAKALSLRSTAAGTDASTALSEQQLRLEHQAPEAPPQQQRHQHRFWSSQPVPQYNETCVTCDGPIDERPRLDPASVPEAPYPLLAGFSWCELDISAESDIQELYELLRSNYVEDDDAQFRFDYSPAFLRWALSPPGWKRVWHVGVRVSTSSKLVAFIAAVPVTMRLRDVKALAVVEVNFLCIHKRLRHKRLAPVLIREITRRAHRQGIYQAVYTAGTLLPRPLVTCRYWHRSLDARKLIECGFSRLRPRMTMKLTERLYALPEKPLHPDVMPLERRHCASARALLSQYLETHTKFHPCFSETEFEHWFLPRDDVIYSFVRVQRNTSATGTSNERVTDLISFYSLPSSVIHSSKHRTLRAAYSFYNVATSCSFQDLMQDALILAKNAGFDVFNALHLMENREVFDQLKFAPGDGELHYYVYNWRTSVLRCEENGLVML
ncbi:N-myristoyltransferase [Cyanidioschyzon merolae strain 10D]|uniref:Glycylpeptide N-tetradecanoyltransferase n=1 Tax=Cyanidioschyzon merolae (strain NIES-3377 / 10D) TaxID=280699 RepID=M1V3Y1_CYAM1|nr:N-myristoyltransferase [Cyanidioschyzon merolae strain 10D]BAM79010.1 N-myristoyltransferase [Cyanidioschyzon merolae strain 10D]|eukprot:XP_005535296.1 N-myristoyltransferase [Cyanidioschyzon merolae strain 10D]